LIVIFVIKEYCKSSIQQLHGDAAMTQSPKHDRPGGNPTLWTVAALRWALQSPEHELAIGQEIETVEAPDRELAVAIAHHLLDKHAHEAFGETGLEIHIVPPAQMPSDEPSRFRQYKVSAEARRQARTLGIRGDVETRVARMARLAARFTHPMANVRYQRFIMRVEGDTITWIGIENAASTR
jgi:hypothetical protein